jgi:6-phosphofructokinase 2
LLEGLLDAEGLTHRPIPVEEMTRQNRTVGERVSDHQYRFTMPGPTLSELEADRCLRATAELDPIPGDLAASGSLPPGAGEDFYGRLARTLPAGCRLIVDTNGPALRHAVEAGANLIKPNMRELGELAGTEIADDEQVEAAARDLIETHGVQAVVVSLGAAGAAVVTRQRTERIPSPTVPIRSRVGAGDSMVAGMTLRLAAGASIEEAARFGVAAGAAAVMTPGTELCRKEDAERLDRHMAAEMAGASAGSNT